MKEIFDDYLKVSFLDEPKQATFKFKQFALNYRNFFPQDKSAKLLDIGIGRGEMLSFMKDHGYKDFYGIDISEPLVKFCQSINLPCEKVENTTNWLRDKKNNYQLITLLDVLEHIKKDEAYDFLVAIKDSLTNDGAVIIQTPNLQAFEGQLHRYNDYTHEFGFTENSLRQLLATAGLKPVLFGGFEYVTRPGLLATFYKFCRGIYWRKVRFVRRLTGNINPEVLHPVFFCYAKK